MKLSIIIPTLRENNALKLLMSLWHNSYTPYEVILVTTEDIKAKLEEVYVVMNYTHKFVIDDKQIGTTYAIQKGLEVATGDYIVCLSDDCLVSPYWDRHMLNFLESLPKDKITLGNFRIYDATGEMSHLGYFGFQFSMFPIISRVNLAKLGDYYSTEYNAFYADPDLGIRVALNGGIVVNCPTSFIYHPYNPDTLHLNNKSKYFASDEEIFKKKWNIIGEFKGCEVLK